MNIIMLGIKNNIQLLLHISFAWLMTVYGVLQLQVKCWRGLKSQREPHLYSADHAVILGLSKCGSRYDFFRAGCNDMYRARYIA
jgi:hypothetical protein